MVTPNSLANLRRGNPGNGGRPNGSLSLSGLLRQELDRGDGRRAKTLVRALIDSAIAGDTAAAKLILDRVDGPVWVQSFDEIPHQVKAYIGVTTDELRGLPKPAIEAEKPINAEFQAEG